MCACVTRFTIGQERDPGFGHRREALAAQPQEDGLSLLDDATLCLQGVSKTLSEAEQTAR
jgi:hypothetical protein